MVIAINLTGTFLCSKCMIPGMKQIGEGRPGKMFQRLIDGFSEDVGVDIIAQTKAFAAEVAAEVGDLSGVDAYRFGKKSTD